MTYHVSSELHVAGIADWTLVVLMVVLIGIAVYALMIR